MQFSSAFPFTCCLLYLDAWSSKWSELICCSLEWPFCCSKKRFMALLFSLWQGCQMHLAPQAGWGSPSHFAGQIRINCLYNTNSVGSSLCATTASCAHSLWGQHRTHTACGTQDLQAPQDPAHVQCKSCARPTCHMHKKLQGQCVLPMACKAGLDTSIAHSKGAKHWMQNPTRPALCDNLGMAWSGPDPEPMYRACPGRHHMHVPWTNPPSPACCTQGTALGPAHEPRATCEARAGA